MLGYRLIRSVELDALRTELRSAQEQRIALLERLCVLNGECHTKATMADLLITRVNVLEQEAAQGRHAKTGLPTVAPQIGRPSAVESAALSAGVDIFEDVGDQEADRLSKAGLLHDTPAFDLPSARDLTAAVAGR